MTPKEKEREEKQMNLIKSIEKQIEQGNVFIAKDGNFISAEKVTTLARKAYVKGLGDGSISFDTPYESFYTFFVEDYRSANDVIIDLFGKREETAEAVPLSE